MDTMLQTIAKGGATTSQSPVNYEYKAQGFPSLPTSSPRNTAHPPHRHSPHSNNSRNQNPQFSRNRKFQFRKQNNLQSETPGYSNASPRDQVLGNSNESHKASPTRSGASNAAPPQTSKNPDVKTNKDKENVGCEVQVSGYLKYTQPQDLKQAFSKFGPVKDVRMYNKQAVVSFATAAEAGAAVQASMKVNVYGQFLTVIPQKPGQAIRNKHQITKREFPRSKEKGTVLDPKQVDLSGDFSEQLDKILATIRLTKEEVQHIMTLYGDLQEALQDAFPDCVAMPFGSIVSGLGIKSSDADCFVDIPPPYRYNQVSIVNRAKRELSRYPEYFSEILCIPRANTPIVKFFHIPTETNCDVSFKTLLGVQNSKLISFLLQVDPRLIPLCVVIKYWAKVHGLSGTGKLTNYALILLVIFYLQQPTLKILPAIYWLQRDPANDFIVDFWNTGFASDLPPVSCETSMSELLGGFFEFYSIFNFEEMMVCPYLGYPLKKEIFKDTNQLPNEFERYKENVMTNNTLPIRFTTSICIQDPIEQGHNVGCSISSRLAIEIKAYFKFAAVAYENDKANHLEKFLKIILLQKPKLVREKSNPEYRVHLFPKIIANIVSPDWKSVMREVVYTVFEKMLHLKLEKMEEKVTPNARKQKEKYIGTITKHIWKRKQFNKEYNNVNLNLEEKESKITEQILKTDKSSVKLDFQLMVTFNNDPKSGMLGVKLVNGSVEAFRDFGKFFISQTHHWFINLLRPHSKNLDKNVAARIVETLKVCDKNMVKNNEDLESVYDKSTNDNVASDDIANDDIVHDDMANDNVNNDSDNENVAHSDDGDVTQSDNENIDINVNADGIAKNHATIKTEKDINK